MRPNRLFRRFSTILPLALLGISGAADGQVVTLFEHDDFRGRSQSFSNDVANLKRSSIGNDRASSILVDPGCEVTVYEDSNYRGRSETLTRDAADLDHLRVRNDSISSLQVYCRDSQYGDPRHDRYEELSVTVYSKSDFNGYQEVFYRDDPYLVDNKVGNNRIRSLRVPNGCEVTLYEHEDYGGKYLTLNRDHTDLRQTQLSRVGISSLRVSCEDSGSYSNRQNDRRNDQHNNRRDGRYDDRYNDRRGDRPQRGVTFFRDDDFHGPQQTFFNDHNNLKGSSIGNDSISSIQIDPGCRVTLFRDASFSGRSMILTRDISSLRGTEVGHDAVSSFRIDCRRGWR